MMNINAIINLFSQKHHTLNKKLLDLRKSFGDEDELWVKLENLENTFFTNAEAFDFLADSLQLVNNVERLKKYELKDINDMYKLLVTHYPDNIKYQTDLINFTLNVLGDYHSSKLLLERLDKYLDEKTAIVKALLKETKDDMSS